MAETIHYRLERMIPDYEILKSLNIMTDEEVKKLHKKREDFEYKLQGHLRSKEEFKEYLRTECILLLSLKEKVPKGSTGEKVIQNLLTRIKTLYQNALTYYKEDLDLWTSYIHMLIRFECIAETSQVFSNVFKYHSDKPMIFIRGADFEFKTAKNIENAKNILERGLEKHPTSAEISKAYIIFLLESAGLRKSSAAPGSETINPEKEKHKQLTLKNAIQVFENSSPHLKEIQFHIDLVKALQEFEKTEKFQDKILHHILNIFPNKEELYDFFAQRHLEGYLFEEKDSEVNSVDDDDRDPYKRCKNEILNLKYCDEIYDKACEKLGTQKMWTLYLRKLSELNMKTDNLKNYKRELLGKAFKKCNDTGKMSEELYLLYISLLFEEYKLKYPQILEREEKTPAELEEEEKFLNGIFEKAVTIHKNSAKLWRKYLELAMKLNKDKLVDQVFEKAIKATPDESLQLWLNYRNYYQTKAGHEYEGIFLILKRAVNEGSATVSNHFKPLLIEFAANYLDPYETRTIYEELTKNSKPCLEIHYKMAEYEKFFLEDSQARDNQAKCDHLRKCFENAVQFFGSTEPEVSILFARIDFNQQKLIFIKINLNFFSGLDKVH